MDNPRAVFGPELDEINLRDAVEVDLDDVRQRLAQLAEAGEHLWVMGTLHVITDPGMGIDDVTLDASNFIGVTALRCLWCQHEYAIDVAPACRPDAVLA